MPSYHITSYHITCHHITQFHIQFQYMMWNDAKLPLQSRYAVLSRWCSALFSQCFLIELSQACLWTDLWCTNTSSREKYTAPWKGAVKTQVRFSGVNTQEYYRNRIKCPEHRVRGGFSAVETTITISFAPWILLYSRIFYSVSAILSFLFPSVSLPSMFGT